MLFECQRNELEGTEHDLYLAAGAHLKQGKVALVTGVRTKTEPREIIANVEYIETDGTATQVFNNILDPVEFERFLDNFAMKISTTSKGTKKLVELDHHFKPVEEDRYDLTDQQKNAVLYVFLVQLINENTRQDAVQAAGLVIKTYLKEKQNA